MAFICVFCGSQSGNQPVFAEAAEALGATLAQQEHTLVYGGGSIGLMGVLADSMLRHGGQVIGVIPEALASVELMHAGVADMRVVPDMHIRKATMHQLTDAYVALPGGFGTMEELFEALCWAQLDFHTAPIALLNLHGLYDGLVRLIDDMIAQGFLNADYRRLLVTVKSIEELQQWLLQTVTSGCRAVQ